MCKYKKICHFVVNCYKLINTSVWIGQRKIHFAVLNVTMLAALPHNMSNWTSGSLRQGMFELTDKAFFVNL